MAFAGTFFSEIREVVDGKSNLTTSAEQLAKLLNKNDDSRSSDSSGSKESFNSPPPYNDKPNDYTAANYHGILDTDLAVLTAAQKNIFIAILSVLCVLSLCGNVCTLFVNFRRKIRPFFRACLISLAFSDLMNTVFLTASYLSQFTADFIQIWSLGAVMCSLVPFATTCAILASSMTLVGIALDRYFAVMKAVIGFWNPSIISCIACMLCIWLASISIASPAFTFYYLIPMYVLTKEPAAATAAQWPKTLITPPATARVEETAATNSALMMPKKSNMTFKGNSMKSPLTQTMRFLTALELEAETKMKISWDIDVRNENFSYTLVRKKYLVDMCMSDQKNVSVYYIIVFTIIFVPCIIAFFWFNTVIARKLWKRRHLSDVTKQKKPTSKNKTKIINIEPPSEPTPTHTAQPESVLMQNKTCTCKSIQTSSTIATPSSLSNTLCGQAKTTATGCANNKNNAVAKSNANHSREARHLRMFIIILLMMAVFVFLRLPAWIFLLMRMYGNYSTPRCWMLYFVFGLMNLASSVLNPLFYTFLSETLKYVLKFKVKVTSLQCGRFWQNLCCCCGTKNHLDVGRCSHLWNWQQSKVMADLKYVVHTHSVQSEIRSKEEVPGIHNEKDEGVECNDEVDEENVCSAHDYNDRIYTIFPSSLVSSSINSEN